MIGTCLRALVLPHLAREGDAGLARQHPVQQDQVRQGVAHQPCRLLGVAGAQHVVAGVLQIERQELLDGRFVFDHEDVRGHRHVSER